MNSTIRKNAYGEESDSKKLRSNSMLSKYQGG